MPASVALTAADFVGRLALGTAQLGLDYGINNTAGRPPDATVHEVLSTAQAAGISLLDTAAAYGDSEARLGQWLSRHYPSGSLFQVVTKVAAGPAAQVQQQLRESLGRLRQPAVYGVMFHSFSAFREQPGGWAALQEARHGRLAQRIGVSLYHPQEAVWLLEEGLDVDLVQVPYNVLDQRFGPLLPELARRGVEVHVRSAFLQGLLLREPATLPAFFAPLAPKLTRLQRLAQTADVPLPALLLQFAACAPGVSRAVVGVDSAANLRENLAAATHLIAAEQRRPELQELAEKTDDFILPYTWPPRS
ncbi:aldo/keto reductase [Hymenobacter ruricola]|uniref:Aldo/keto reductase n=1 Tax=Hymenobacter ruricola TaxID=2791023 RepID=A0ABS0I1K7_9BACT|nr:aldo/keto reductase [Hymenobacter ruricola]MBF9220827.1 aldo/keto reductase [Hymenobacter ruricola]